MITPEDYERADWRPVPLLDLDRAQMRRYVERRDEIDDWQETQERE